jgi:lipopolysaccharide transport system ATP-binding protein
LVRGRALIPGGTIEEFWALKDVSFEVKRGEVLGIIGRNGAGKSTLLKILSRITEPTAGRVTIRGRVASLLEVGTGFHPELTGRENIFLNGAILGMSRAETKRKFNEIVAFAEVEKFVDTPVKRYSSGMYVRLAFAVAAHLDPEILVVDEVLAVGDAGFQKKCLGKMSEVSGEGGRTILFVSHNLGVLRNLCKNVCWLDQGRVLRVGPIHEVVDEYLRKNSEVSNRYVLVADAQRSQNYGQQLRIQAIEWQSEPSLVHDGPAGVRIYFTALTDVDEASISIGFSSLDGTRLLTYESDLYGRRQQIQKGRSGVCELHVRDLPLTPGYYAVDVGARSGDLHGIDFLAGFTHIQVVPNRQTPGNLLATGASVRIPSGWIWHIDDEGREWRVRDQ